MIKELVWDSALFGKKIGELTITSQNPGQIVTAVEKAKADGFQYIICKIHSLQTSTVKLLESLDFYLSDIGVTWEVETNKFLYENINKNLKTGQDVKTAVESDIPRLKKISKSLFTESRFYNDSFFSREEADALYQAWTENSVKGKAADVVLYMQDTGFITCKKTVSNSGEIVLIGIKKEFRNKGVGTILMEEAIKWFKKQGVNLVSVRTQLKNLNAINLYLKSGFYVKGYDIVFAKIL